MPTFPLFCPHCEYNLTGLTEDRCPECGQAFDRAALARWATQRDAPLTLGPDGTTQNLWSGIGLPSLFAPKRLARRLPPLASRLEAIRYSLIPRSLTCLILIALATVDGRGLVVIPLAVLLCIAVTSCSLLCEVAVAGVLAWLVVPRSVPRTQSYHFWRNLCHCFSTYLALTPALILATIGPLIWRPPLKEDLFVLLAQVAGRLGPLGILLWWWIALAKVIYARGLPSARRAVAAVVIPLISLVTAILGGLLVKLLDACV